MTHPLGRMANPVKERLLRKELTLGLFVLSGSAMVMEACATLPFDWLLVDAEASPVSNETILHLLQVTAGSGVAPFVRVPCLDHHTIEHVLDLGAFGVLVPKVDSPAMARAAVEAAYYPPLGRRGINPVRASGYFADVPGYLRHANQRTACLVQIETCDGLARADEIAAVPGVDALFVGPGDLASALGQPGDVTGPAMDEATRVVLKAARNHGKAAGIFAYSTELAQRYVCDGYTFVAVGNDLKHLRSALTDELQAVRGAP